MVTVADREQRIYQAAGITAGQVDPSTASVVTWLAGWDDHTINGVCTLLTAARAQREGPR